MKKTIISLLLAAVLSASFIHVSAETKVATVSGTIYLAQGITVPEGGLPVTVIIGKKGTSSSGGGAGGVTVGSGTSRDGLGYDGTSTFVPQKTDYLKGFSKIISKSQETFVIPYGRTSVEYSIDAPLEFLGNGSVDKFAIAYEVNSDDYVGYGWNDSRTLESNIFIYSLSEKVSVSGEITVPEHENDLEFTVVAEANRNKRYAANGSYTASQDYVFKSEGTIPANTTTAEYSVNVLSNKNYTVYVVFDGDEFVRREKELGVITDDAEVNFENIQKSNEYSGTIKLPEDMTEFLKPDGTELDEIDGAVYLQSASAPYYYLDTYVFEIKKGETSAPFTLIDGMGADEVIMYFELYDNIKDVYGLGNYKSNTETVPAVSGATEITSPGDGFTVCVPKGKTVYPAVDYENGNLPYEYDICVIPQADEGILKDYETAEYFVNCSGISSAGTESGRYVKNYAATIPQNCGYTVMAVSDYYKTEFYANDEKFLENSGNAKLFAADDKPYISLGKNPFMFALSPNGAPYCKADGEDDASYRIGFSLSNKSRADFDNVLVFFALYDENGKLLNISSKAYSVSSRNIMRPNTVVPKELARKTKYMKFFVWADGAEPIARVQSIDNFTID